MKDEIKYSPAFSLADIQLEEGETVVVESGSMVAFSDNMEIKTTLGAIGAGLFAKLGALVGALVRKIFGGESIFLNHYTPAGGPGRLMIAPSMVGEIIKVSLKDRPLFVQASSFLAATPGVSMRTIWGGFRMLLGGEGLFLLRLEGDGEVWINSYGAIKKIDVDGDYIVDSGHTVAFTDGLDRRAEMLGGIKTGIFSGEGLVLRFSGKGSVYMQSRDLGALVRTVIPFLPR